jgi:hypothetical protein
MCSCVTAVSQTDTLSALVPVIVSRLAKLEINAKDLPPRKPNTFVSIIVSCQRLVANESSTDETASRWSWYSCDRDSTTLFEPLQSFTDFYNATAINEEGKSKLQLDLSRFKITHNNQQDTLPVTFEFKHKHKANALNLFRFVLDIYESKNYAYTASTKPMFILSIPSKKNEKAKTVEFNQCVVAILRQLDPTHATDLWADSDSAAQNMNTITSLLDGVPNHPDNVPPMKHPRMFLARQSPLNFAQQIRSGPHLLPPLMIPSRKNTSLTSNKAMFTLTPTSPSVSTLLPFGVPVRSNEPRMTSPAEGSTSEETKAVDIPLKKDLLRQYKSKNNKRPQAEGKPVRKRARLSHTSSATEEPTILRDEEEDTKKEIAEALIFLNASDEIDVTRLTLTTKGEVLVEYQKKGQTMEQAANDENKGSVERFCSDLYSFLEKCDRTSVLKNAAVRNLIVSIFYDDDDDDYFCVFDTRFCCSVSLVAMHLVDDFVNECGFDSKILHRSSRKRRMTVQM